MLVGGSSDNCPLSAFVDITAKEYFRPLTVHTTYSELKSHPKGESFIKEILSITGDEFKETLDNQPSDWPLRTMTSMCSTKIVVQTRSQIFSQIIQNDAGIPAYFK